MIDSHSNSGVWVGFHVRQRRSWQNANRERYYVLLLFAFLGTQQCHAWYTFGGFPSQFGDYFGLTSHEADTFADLSMSYGGIVFCIVIVPERFFFALKPLVLSRETQIVRSGVSGTFLGRFTVVP